ncbi:CDP-glycerol glycerophosphotransferase family protein [Floccifex sp.]|uniref:CDP-glycerol glycerophosphotransferase family protein n=1 Tax=Floccifex sp. TaxID=2815810 RepID=UPI002A74F33B|nr:CDP-glycerol glycerophosphotransferase family protein [Floccifex sp.]MDY2958643.1 CDP-glycerol glycerophosphotransferase family protein [Floccifex sp.]
MIKWIKKIVHKCIVIFNRLIYRLIPVDDHTILFIAFHGRGYSDNPKAIHQAMMKDDRFKDYKFVWAIKHHKSKNLDIPNAKIIEYFSLSYFYYLAHSKIWVVNCKLPGYVLKKENQIYLQTWHGTPLKRLAHDIVLSEDATFYRSQMDAASMYKTYDVDVARYNYMISPNAFCSKIFPSAFAIDPSKLIETGYPRNDVLSHINEQDVMNKKKELHLPLDKKVILYAPTWRDNSYVAQGYTFQLKADFRKWKEILGDDYIVLFKPHYLIINSFKEDEQLNGFLYSMDATMDIAQLYELSDILITDYSSVFFDYAILNRPIYFYMYDLEEYAQDLRGFYLDIHKDLPGKIYRNEEDLLVDLKNNVFDYEHLKEFNAYFNNKEDGNASKRVIDILYKEINHGVK